MSHHDEENPKATRRGFLRASGIGAAGLLVGALAGDKRSGLTQTDELDLGFTPLPARREPGFDHVVVLMFENRSFDHILGWLYQDGQVPVGQSFDGLHQGTYENVAPDGTVVPAHVYEGSTDYIMSQPNPDPGEFYSHVNTQLFGTIDPKSNDDPSANGISAPFNHPTDVGSPDMSGFVKDYIVNFRSERGGAKPTPAEYGVVMGGFSPEMLPVLSALARNFGVYDHWYAAVPSQTFCNRSFFHASTSNGFVTNDRDGGFGKWLTAPAAPTLFDRLEEAGLPWRVYYDEDQVVSLTGMINAPALEKYWKSNFRGMKQFHEDAKSGNLPAYSFIEPRMIFDHNDMHPPVSRPKVVPVPGEEPYDSAMSDMRAGEALLASIYNAIRTSAAATGSNAMNTALVVTFDEHGGIYDHVAPPSVATPDGKTTPGEMGFTFDRLGCRVPSIVVSAYTRSGTVINETMHHGAITKTICQLHGLEPLNFRDDTATGIFNAVNLTTPRQPALWPEITAPYVPPNPESHGRARHRDKARPLTPPAQGLLGLLLAKYEPTAPVPQSYGDALAILEKHGQNLFGLSD